MNIFWIITDSICNYTRPDNYGLLSTYNKLKQNYEGFYFEDAISLFPSSVLSILSMINGRFPYYILPDHYQTIKEIPKYEFENFILPLKNTNYFIQSVMSWRGGAIIFYEILNTYYEIDFYRGNKLIDAKKMYQLIVRKISKLSLHENNLFIVHFRENDPKTDFYLNKFIKYLKEKDFWDNSIVIINSDHGYYDRKRYKKRKLLHFDDIHQSSLETALFLKIPGGLTNTAPRVIKNRVYLIDVFETILDYLNIQVLHERESISFKELIENHVDVNNNRKIRADCYLMYQPLKKAALIKDNWKLINNKGNFALYNLKDDELEENDIKTKFPIIYNELFNFYLDTESKAVELMNLLLDDLYKKSYLSSLKSEKILIPHQFPTLLANYLKKKLEINNDVKKSINVIKSNDNFKRNYITIIFFNRLTGYGVKRLIHKYNKITKKFLILDTQLKNISMKKVQTGYFRFFIKSLISHRRQLFKNRKEALVKIFYYPVFINKYLKRFFRFSFINF